MKFTVGTVVGGPATYVAGATPEQEYLGDLLALPGVTSIFMTADFVTISKTPDIAWDSIRPTPSAPGAITITRHPSATCTPPTTSVPPDASMAVAPMSPGTSAIWSWWVSPGEAGATTGAITT
jgi:hypothetical protein